jgi:hypothetical protein
LLCEEAVLAYVIEIETYQVFFRLGDSLVGHSSSYLLRPLTTFVGRMLRPPVRERLSAGDSGAKRAGGVYDYLR